MRRMGFPVRGPDHATSYVRWGSAGQGVVLPSRSGQCTGNLRLRTRGKMRRPHRRQFLHLAAGAVVLSAGARPARAQAYPTRPITLVVPFAAGGSFDVIARVITPRLSEILGQQVIVENVGAAAGIVGVNRVAHAVPDGYSVLLGTVGTHAYNPALYKKLPYNPAADFAPVGLVAEQPLVLIARKDFPPTTRLCGSGLDDASCLRLAQCGGRHRGDARSLSRRRAGDGGYDRRANPIHVLENPPRAAAEPRRPPEGQPPAWPRPIGAEAGAPHRR